ncbi:MAG: formate dehydrogenase accessory protein FdhE [Candidatus Caldarchaeum sp.]|nr:formate dehydrogenase accessory protein FdhE [Candidatus Caldarchaeum sp.]MDW7978023.1 formate dehydrogenase accessory protein FdhE [Candidatus Caldarchaeum sp.]MDW8359819.1 formate dehydrogenase accessory protein FdhE [Candidatus Caldarchaeum sp.]
MSVLRARLKRLEPSHEAVRFASLLITVRDELTEKVNPNKLVAQGFTEKVAFAIQRGLRPLLEDEVLECINYNYFSELLEQVFAKLVEKGSVDGELEQMLVNLKSDPGYSRLLLKSALGLVDNVVPNVEREVLAHIVLVPLQPILKIINKVNSRLDKPTWVKSCLTCGMNYILGSYRGGFRHMVCATCGHIARVDFFYCPTCGTTDPYSMRFERSMDEPYFQIELCDKCGAYYKMVNEDILGNASEDPLLLDFATIDLDNIANSLKHRSG